ncbi:F0F1 ATP synthase subunit gamma, partial [Salmonella enterica]|uniref:F0F1 ATP synthase subunit gamma n=1 Tax=Salmonella enterica TaxID=28901 RepID=UPI003297A9FD
VIGHLRLANPDYKHPFLVEREPKSVGFIVISTDRGLAGGLNVILFNTTLATMREWQQKGAQISLCLIGSKGVQ